jgi:AcrR family transcriptional regulator
MAKVAKAGGHADRSLRTRDRLVSTAMRVFNQVGFWGTDSNELARAAGYSPGTFYRHFTDKRAIFLAAYQAWVAAEDQQLSARLAKARERGQDLAGAFVDFIVEHHGRWRTFRCSMRALAAGDSELQKAIREHRRKHVEQLSEVLGGRDPSQKLLMLYTLDGLTDGISADEPKAFGISARTLTGRVRGLVEGNGASRRS